MNPSYRLQIDLYIRTPVESSSVWMRRIGYLPFVPRAGDTLRIGKTDHEEEQVDLSLDEVVWDMAGGMFVATAVDESVVEGYSEGVPSGSLLNSVTEEYKGYGFLRLNYPQAQVVRSSDE